MDDENAIAIVGIACRFPGAEDIDEFWDILRKGECHLKEVPPERWNLSEVGLKEEDESWKKCAEHAGLINDFDKWDNKFFGISDTEAGCMDPQQCLALEVTHSALENGGFTKEMVKGSKTGVYMDALSVDQNNELLIKEQDFVLRGVMNDDMLFGVPNATNDSNNFMATGIARSITSNRISYHYDLRGPSLTLDTACSSALVAVHLGCQAINAGDCDMAICGGVNSLLSPVLFVALSKAKMVSPTGISHSFSNEADGYVRGEGCGIVILKKFSKAKKDGDVIWGVIATGCNQDGQTNTPITAPSSIQQLNLLKEVYARNNVDPGSVQYIEAHGTGTPVGDAIEVEALSSFFKPHIREQQTIPFGSVKTNIGHLESSAGTAGLIKVLLMMKHGKFVPSLHYEKGKGNPGIDFDSIPLYVSTEGKDWVQNAAGKKLACINSFGFGGTNCHAIVMQNSNINNITDCGSEDYIVCLTGTSIQGLNLTIEHTKEKLTTQQYNIRDVSYTSLMKRDHFQYRLSFIGRSCQELIDEIQSHLDKSEDMLPVNNQGCHLVFLFCGVGTVWEGTCREMLKYSSTFKQKFDEIDKKLQQLTIFSLLKYVFSDASDISEDPFKGPLVIFACQVSLFHAWDVLGIMPDKIVGQSVGEVAAAHAAGCITLDDAIKIIYHRSHLTAKASGGKMMAIGNCNIDDIENYCQEKQMKVCIAVYSSKESCVVSGDSSLIEKMKEDLKAKDSNILLKELDVGCAYHSYHMDTVTKEIQSVLGGLNKKSPSIKIISTVTGNEVQGDEMSQISYWCRNLRDPVLLKDAVINSIQSGKTNVILEIGPKPVVRAHLKKITDLNVTSITSLNQPLEKKTFNKAMAQMFKMGFSLDFKRTLFYGFETLTDIPRYRFNRTKILMKSEHLREALQAKAISSAAHPFVERKPLSSEFKIELTKKSAPFVFEHIVDGRKIAPGATYVEMGLFIAKYVLNVPYSLVKLSLRFIRPLVVGNQSITLESETNDVLSTVSIKRNKETLCAIQMTRMDCRTSYRVDLDELKQTCDTFISSDIFYNSLRSLGFQYGSLLTIIGDCWISTTEYIAEMIFDEKQHDTCNKMILPPVVLDGALQTIALCFIAKIRFGNGTFDDKPIPIKIKSLRIHREVEQNMTVIGRLVKTDEQFLEMNVLILSQSGDAIVEIEGYEVQNIAVSSQVSTLSDKFYALRWTKLSYSYKISETNSKIFAITITEKGKIFLKSHLKSDVEYAVLQSSNTKFDSKDIMNGFEKYLTGNLSNFSKVVFHPGLVFDEELLTSEEIFEMVQTSCLVLTTLVKCFVKDKLECSLYVITKQSQPSVRNDVNINTINVIGSELWGMVRCLLRERIFSKTHLIDLDDDEDGALISDILLGSSTEEWLEAPEFKIEDKTIFINQITRNTPDVPTFRRIAYTDSVKFELRSSSFRKIDDAFFVNAEEPSSDLQNDFIAMKVTNAYFNDTWMQSTNTIEDYSKNPWTNFQKEGYPVFPTEITGFQIAESMKSDSSCLLVNRVQPHNVNNAELVTCFPTKCGNIVSIPLSCTIDKSLVPNYKPCILMEMVMVMELVERSDSTIPIIVVYEQNFITNKEMICSIFDSFERTLLAFKPLNQYENDINLEGKIQLFLLTKDSNKVFQIITPIHEHVCRVMAFSNHISKAAERKLRQSFPGIIIRIVNSDEILCLNELSKTVSKIKEMLKKRNIMFKRDNEYLTDTLSVSFTSEGSSNKPSHLSAQLLPVIVTGSKLFSKMGIYIIVGGLSGLGWELVKNLCRSGAGIVAIFARSSANDAKIIEIESLMKEHECIIEHLKVDITEMSSVKREFSYLSSKYTKQSIRGIFHGGAVVDDSIILNMTSEKMYKVLRPKVLGTLNLHKASLQHSLDYFVLHSSITSAFGNSGQTNYGAGNAFQDSFAFYRRSKNLSGQTINWGPLKLGLLKTYEHVEKHLNSQGFISLTESEIIDCFTMSLLSSDVQIIIANFDWKTVIRQSPDMLHLTSRIGSILKELNIVDIFTMPDNEIISIDPQELIRLPREEQRRKVTDVVILVAADIFAVESSTLNDKTLLYSLGIDSMKGMAFINSIYMYVSCKIPILSVLGEEDSIESITSEILDQINIGSKTSNYIPSEKIHEFRKKFDEIKTPLHAVEKTFLGNGTNTDKVHFAFIEVVFYLKEGKVLQGETVNNALTNLLNNHPELSYIYVNDKNTIYKIEDISELIALDTSFKDYTEKIQSESFLKLYENDLMRKSHLDWSDLRIENDHDKLSVQTTHREEVHGTSIFSLAVQERPNERIVFRFSRLNFDFYSVNRLVSSILSLQIESKMKSLDIKKKLISSKTKLRVDGIFEETEEKRQFWNQRLQDGLSPGYLTNNQSMEAADVDMIIRRLALTETESKQIINWTKDRKICIRDLILAAYHLMLKFIMNGTAIISIVTNISVRQSSDDTIASLETIAPIIIKNNDDKETIEFVRCVSKEREMVSTQLLPMESIETLLVDKTAIGNLAAHAVFLEEYHFDANLNDQSSLKFERICSVDSRFVSSIHIISPTEIGPIEIEMHSPPRFATESIMVDLLTGLKMMAFAMIEQERMSLQQIRKHYEKLVTKGKQDDGHITIKNNGVSSDEDSGTKYQGTTGGKQDDSQCTIKTSGDSSEEDSGTKYQGSTGGKQDDSQCTIKTSGVSSEEDSGTKYQGTTGGKQDDSQCTIKASGDSSDEDSGTKYQGTTGGKQVDSQCTIKTSGDSSEEDSGTKYQGTTGSKQDDSQCTIKTSGDSSDEDSGTKYQSATEGKQDDGHITIKTSGVSSPEDSGTKYQSTTEGKQDDSHSTIKTNGDSSEEDSGAKYQGTTEAKHDEGHITIKTSGVSSDEDSGTKYQGTTEAKQDDGHITIKTSGVSSDENSGTKYQGSTEAKQDDGHITIKTSGVSSDEDSGTKYQGTTEAKQDEGHITIKTSGVSSDENSGNEYQGTTEAKQDDGHITIKTSGVSSDENSGNKYQGTTEVKQDDGHITIKTSEVSLDDNSGTKYQGTTEAKQDDGHITIKTSGVSSDENSGTKYQGTTEAKQDDGHITIKTSGVSSDEDSRTKYQGTTDAKQDDGHITIKTSGVSSDEDPGTKYQGTTEAKQDEGHITIKTNGVSSDEDFGTKYQGTTEAKQDDGHITIKTSGVSSDEDSGTKYQGTTEAKLDEGHITIKTNGVSSDEDSGTKYQGTNEAKQDDGHITIKTSGGSSDENSCTKYQGTTEAKQDDGHITIKTSGVSSDEDSGTKYQGTTDAKQDDGHITIKTSGVSSDEDSGTKYQGTTEAKQDEGHITIKTNGVSSDEDFGNKYQGTNEAKQDDGHLTIKTSGVSSDEDSGTKYQDTIEAKQDEGHIMIKTSGVSSDEDSATKYQGATEAKQDDGHITIKTSGVSSDEYSGTKYQGTTEAKQDEGHTTIKTIGISSDEDSGNKYQGTTEAKQDEGHTTIKTIGVSSDEDSGNKYQGTTEAKQDDGHITIKTSGVSSDKDSCNKYQVLKQTKHGWNRHVCLSIECTSNTKKIKWSSSKEKSQTKCIEAKDISELNYTTMNGLKTIIFKTLERTYIFKSFDEQKMQKIWDNLRSFT